MGQIFQSEVRNGTKTFVTNEKWIKNVPLKQLQQQNSTELENYQTRIGRKWEQKMENCTNTSQKQGKRNKKFTFFKRDKSHFPFLIENERYDPMLSGIRFPVSLPYFTYFWQDTPNSVARKDSYINICKYIA